MPELKVVPEAIDDDTEILWIHPPGRVVALSDQLFRCTVSQVSIHENNHIMYEVVLWNGPERQNFWVEASEVHGLDDQEKMAIGFVPGVKKEQ